MSKEIVQQEVQIPETWDYEKAIESLKGKIITWKHITYEIAEELYIARFFIKRQGNRSDLVTVGTKSWQDFCKDIGINRMSAHRWITKFFPIEEGQIKIPFPENKYRVIYADPPWRYTDRDYMGLSVEEHYPTMTTEDICKLPIRELAFTDCTLFLWCPSSQLPEGFTVISAWGFEYKAMIVWDKVKHTPGHYTSVRHECCLIGIIGSGVPLCDPKIIANTDSVLVVKKTSKHSEKPEEMRKVIERLYPDCPKIELFARKKVESWDTWGLEV